VTFIWRVTFSWTWFSWTQATHSAWTVESI